MDIELIEGEIFKPVPQYAGYIQASNKGRIYTDPREVKKFCGLHNKFVTQKYKGRLLSPYKSGGYMQVTFGINNKTIKESVSRLVLSAFDKNEPDLFACHNDSNTENNCLENLRWDTQTGNMKDREDRGLYFRGSAHPMAKVPEWLAIMLSKGEITPSDAAKKYGFRYSHLWRISKGHVWKHLKNT